MKIALAQTRPVKGNIQRNTEVHVRFVHQATEHGADAIFFPELSITGYEPALAARLAGTPGDSHWDVFRHLSTKHDLHIGIGAPIRTGKGVHIAMIIFSPGRPAEVYTKQYLHADETPFFIPGKKNVLSFERDHKISLAICYELSVPAHAAAAGGGGAQIYIASVAKTAPGVQKAMDSLSETAGRYAMTVMMVNCVGHCDDFDCGGRTAAWNNTGMLIGQLSDKEEGLLLVDTASQLLMMP